MTDGEIRELDPRTVERIAAGEVVERPASVVKELVENSLDADASRVDVSVSAGGTDGIRVSDDGEGMSESALRRAVEKHTTSKIADVADLEAGVSTLGFRGEALHAIGAVARLTITSRPRDGDRATALTVEGGEVTDVSPAGRPPGTTVEVEDLFYNVPARRKYLKTESTEFARVNTHVRSYALANPDVAVSLSHDGRETFATTGGGDLREAVLSVYGREVATAMVPVEAEDLPDGPLAGVSGLVSDPETTRASRDYLSTFVNGRYVRSSSVREGVVAAYGDQLGPDRYPFAVCFLEVDPGAVDVNVHPRKLEVRFEDDAGVRRQVRDAVASALREAGTIRSSAPRGRSAPDQARISPGGEESGSGDGSDVDDTQDGEDPTAAASEATTDPDADEPTDGASATPRGTPADRPREPDEPTQVDDPADGSTSTDERSDASAAGVEGARSSGHGSHGRRGHASDHAGVDGDREDAADVGSERDDPVGRTQPDSARKFRDAGEQTRFGDGEAVGDDLDRLPAMRLLGQLHETYLVAETETGLVLIDQHAADERVNYERLRAEFAGETTTQTLAEPVTIELTAGEAELFEARREALASLGFQARLVEDDRVAVATVPAAVADGGGAEVLRDVLASFVTDASPAETVEAAADDLLADLACYPSITGNTSLTEGSMRDLLAALDECENPYACPHGRPVVIELDRDELEARFERDYPGHGG